MALKTSKYVHNDDLADRPKGPGFPAPSRQKAQFINITDATSLDKAARTKVRVQAMRDYHRRRIEIPDGVAPVSKLVRKKPPSAKAQTLKIRLGQENVLRPWVPVRSGLEQKVVKRNDGSEMRKVLGFAEGISVTSRRILNGENGAGMLGDFREENILAQGLDGTLRDWSPIDPWLSEFELILEPTKLYSSPGAGQLDPFSAMAVIITPRIQLLIDHYFNIRQQTAWLMLPMRKTLFTLAIHDTAMFHSFTTHYATSFNVRFNNGSATESLYHTNMAVRILNERLSDPLLEQVLTDETIATVANMAAFESSNGTKESMVVHMDGLERMVYMRGGIENGGFPMIVQRMIGWADYHVATSLLEKPRFPPLKLPQRAQPRQATQFLLAKSTTLPPQNYIPSLEALFSGIRSLSLTLRSFRQKAHMPTEDIWYSDEIYYLQRNLFEIACHFPLPSSTSFSFTSSFDTNIHPATNSTTSDSVCALAALIYCGHCLRDVPLSYTVTTKAVTRLRRAILEYENENFWIGDGEVTRKMVWVLAFGGVAAEGKPEWGWFVEKFRACFEDLLLEGWDGLRVVLDGVLWEPGLDDAGLRLFEESKM